MVRQLLLWVPVPVLLLVPVLSRFCMVLVPGSESVGPGTGTDSCSCGHGSRLGPGSSTVPALWS